MKTFGIAIVSCIKHSYLLVLNWQLVWGISSVWPDFKGSFLADAFKLTQVTGWAEIKSWQSRMKHMNGNWNLMSVLWLEAHICYTRMSYPNEYYSWWHFFFFFSVAHFQYHWWVDGWKMLTSWMKAKKKNQKMWQRETTRTMSKPPQFYSH